MENPADKKVAEEGVIILEDTVTSDLSAPETPVTKVERESYRDLTPRVVRVAPPRSPRPFGRLPIYSDSDPRWHSGRPDQQTRRTALTLIGDVMRSDFLPVVEMVDILADLEEACRKDSVPFSELLHENVDGLDAPPLLLAIIRGDWKEEPELIEYLIEKTKGPKVSWMVRHGCRIAGDNELFHGLRAALNEKPLYTAEVQERPPGYVVTLAVDDLGEELAEVRKYALHRGEKQVTTFRRNKKVELEWIVGSRVWSLEVYESGLSLWLTEGAPCLITASATVVVEETQSTQASSREGQISSLFELTFPPSQEIRPLSAAGNHSISADIPWGTPSYPRSLDVLISSRPRVSFVVTADLKEPAGGNGKINEASEIDGVGWVGVDDEQDDEWVLASWQGKDQDLVREAD